MKLNQRLIITGFIMLVAATSAFALFRNFSKLKPSNTSLSMSSVSETTKKAISDNTIMVFSKSYCPFCKKAKSAIEGLNLKYGVMELDDMKEGSDIQAELLKMTGQKTVPNIFVKGKHIGGCDDTLKAISTGEFQKMLK